MYTLNTNDDKYYIYKITNSINGKIYIGKTKDVKNRWAKHIAMARKKVNRYLYDAMNCYGYDNFTIEVIEECDSASVDERERYYICLYDTTNKANGYNMTLGGEGGNTWIFNPNKEETGRKISIANSGKKRTEESRYNMRIGCRNRPQMSDETKKKISDSIKKFYIEHPEARGKNNHMRGKSGDKHPFYGKHHKDESKKKLSEARAGKRYEDVFDDETCNKLKELHRKQFTGVNNPKYKKIDMGRFEELCLTNLTIKQIAECLGITKEGLYYKFQSELNITPGQYRKKILEERQNDEE